MPTLAYNPGIRITVATRQHGILDVSEDIESGTLTINENNPHSLNFTLSNMGGKYSSIFTPDDRVIVAMKRINWLQVFSGYMDEVPYFSVYPTSVNLTATCTMKRIQQHYWNAVDPVTIQFVQSIITKSGGGGGNGQKALTDVIRVLLTDVVQWDGDKIHIGGIPQKWWDNPYMKKLWQDEKISQQQIIDLMNTQGDVGYTSALVRSGNASVVKSKAGPPGTDLPYSSGTATVYWGPSPGPGAINAVGSNVDLSQTDSGPNPWYCAMHWGYADLPNSEWGAAKSWLAGVTSNVAKHMGLPIVVTNTDTSSKYVGYTMVLHAEDYEANDGSNGNVIDISYPALAYLTNGSTALTQGQNPGAGSVGTGAGGCQVSIAWAADPNQACGPYKHTVKTTSNHVNTGPNASSKNPKSTSSTAPYNNGINGVKAAQYATQQATAVPPIPYVYGGTGPGQAGYDCSGLTYEAWLSAGIDITRTSESQYDNPDISLVPLNSNILPGDLFFADYNDGSAAPGHVAMYVGNGMIAEAPHTGANLHLLTVNDFVSAPAASGIPGAIFMGVGRYTGNPSNKQKSGTAVGVPSTSQSSRYQKNWSKNTVTSTGLGVDGSGSYVLDQLWNVGATPGDPNAFVFTGFKVLMEDTPIYSYIQDLVTASQRHACSAPNGDFIAWFPDYFGVYGTAAKFHVSEIETQGFQVSWSDQNLVTHQYASGSTVTANYSFDPLQSGNSPTENDMMISDGVATIDMPGILNILANVPQDASRGGLWNSADEIYKQFGPRPDFQALPLIGHGEIEFWFALSLFHSNWANMFSATVPTSFLPEVWPGMLLVFDVLGFQGYVTSLTHSWNLSDGGGFQTSINLVAPSAIGHSGLIGMASGGTAGGFGSSGGAGI